MLEMPIRTGRRMQDAARRMQENYTQRTNERQQVNSLHRQRMTCSDSLRFTNTQKSDRNRRPSLVKESAGTWLGSFCLWLFFFAPPY